MSPKKDSTPKKDADPEKAKEGIDPEAILALQRQTTGIDPDAYFALQEQVSEMENLLRQASNKINELGNNVKTNQEQANASITTTEVQALREEFEVF